MEEYKIPRHRIIYLQWDDDEVTWCQDKILDDDIEYIMKSEFDTLRAENEKLREALEQVKSLTSPNMSG